MSLAQITVYKKYCNIYDLQSTLYIDFASYMFLFRFHEKLTFSLDLRVQNYISGWNGSYRNEGYKNVIVMVLSKKYLRFRHRIWGGLMTEWTTYFTKVRMVYA